MTLRNKRFVFFSHYDFNLYRFRGPVLRALSQSGSHVYAVAPPGMWQARFRDLGAEFVPFSLNRLTFNPLSVWRTIMRLALILRRLRPDVVHTFMLRPNVYGAIAAAWVGVPKIVCTVTGLGTLYTNNRLKTRLARWVVEVGTRWALRHAQVVVFQNRDDRAYFLARGLCRPEQARLIRGSGVDVYGDFNPQRFSPEHQYALRRQWGLDGDKPVVLMVARLIEPKGVREFLETARTLRHQAHFVLVGAPDPGNPAVLHPAEIDCYRREGFVKLPGSQSDIAAWMAISDIYVLPSYREGLPRTVLEAMAMGLPVVAADVPGCREVVKHEKTGLLVPPRDVDALVRAVQTLLQNPDLRQRWGSRGREIVVEHFSVEKIVEQYLRLYKSLPT